MAAAAKKKPAAKKAPEKKAAAKKRPAAKKAARPTRTVHHEPGNPRTSEMDFRGTPASSGRRKLDDAALPSAGGRRALLDDPGASQAPIVRAASDYFAKVDKEGVDFVSTGCSLMDACVGGGWALGRVVNIVGDKSAGKTLLAIEAAANFHIQYPDGHIRYGESEAAFDQDYAEAIGLPPEVVEFARDGEAPFDTVEDFYADLMRALDEADKRGAPLLYILDSLDALSDDAEAERDIDKGSFGASKAKKMGELFRRLTRRVEDSRCLLIVISQLRDKINVTFGEKQTRSGGRALDFYASQIVWLAEIGKLTREIEGVKRVVGVDVRAKCKKNKVGLPFRECEYPVVFGYGVDDLTAGAQWLIEVKRDARLKELGMSVAGYKQRCLNLRNKGGEEAEGVRRKMAEIIREEWQRIETKFLPQARKYG